jgi:recombination protein RecT
MTGTDIERQTPKNIHDLVTSRRDDFAAILPRHATVESFMGLAEAYVRRDRNLLAAAKANPASLMIALRECAALGHMPMRGTYSLVPFKTKAMQSEDNPQGWDINGIEEVRGTIQRMYRAGGVTSVHVELIREADQFDWAPARMSMPVHEFDWKESEETRGPIVGVYAWARLRNGGVSQVIVMNMQQVSRYESIAKTAKFWQGPWRPEMIQKTALHRLEKFVPTSAEFLWNMAAAESASATNAFPDLPDRPAVDPYNDGSVVDAEIVDDPPPAADWPETRKPGDGNA